MIRRHDHTPAGTTSFLDLFNDIVKRRHGKNAVAESVPQFTVEGDIFKVLYGRAGKYISSDEDLDRLDLVKESIIRACYEKKMTAYVRDESGAVLKIDQGYWGRGPEADYNEASSGIFVSDTEPSHQHRTIYFQNEEVDQFIDTLFSSAERNLTDKEENFFLKADNWGEVGFSLGTKGITVKVKGTSRYFKSEQFKNIFPSKKNRKFLYKVIKTSGVFSFEAIHNMKKGSLKAYVSDLRKDLRELFGIAADPIPSTGKGGYGTMFSAVNNINKEDSFEQKDILEEQIPEAIRQSIGSNPPEDYFT